MPANHPIYQVCFANNPLSGLLILVGLFFSGTNIGLATVICSVVALATAKVSNYIVLGWMNNGNCISEILLTVNTFNAR